jgi:structural maintenance of chromosome 2
VSNGEPAFIPSTQLLREEVDPQLEKLREEKRTYLAYQKATSELERLTRLVKAYEWTQAVERASKIGDEIRRKSDMVSQRTIELKRFAEEIKGMESDVVSIQKKRDKVIFIPQ